MLDHNVDHWLSLEYALRRQPSSSLMDHTFFRLIAMCCWIGGNIIHFSAMWALGWKGIYHGDHFFGPLEYVESFPYGLIASPMYNGKAISYLGSAIWTAKPAGLVLAVWTFVVFNVTGMIEDKVTSEMYADRKRAAEVKED
ncbi:uncharacterized protein RHO25_002427 [Cercospora beticola]|uniref:Phosphatidyl-N-methylethanolamine N-methyltransferase n=2 Tax=Cercospora beticola TaxID=122368 RepID=A0ABZ0NE53_CERBT|nr:hypothetical protein RHO25_002427 [Cercospora beticola]